MRGISIYRLILNRPLRRFSSRAGASAGEQAYNSLMRYVGKNQMIPQGLAEIAQSKLEQQQAMRLQKAIVAGDATAEIFSHSHCGLYLIYLLRAGQISSAVMQTVYQYLIALMQLTPRQMIRPQDQDVKQSGVVTVYALNDLSHNVGEFYYQQLALALAEIEITVDASWLLRQAQTYEPVEQWLLAVQLPKAEYSDYASLTRSVLGNLPLLQKSPDGQTYLIPSCSMFMAILQAINPQYPFQPMPVFGRLKDSTLLELHRQGRHPVSFYSSWVDKNPVSFHEERSGPLPGKLHDDTHIFMAALIKPREFRFIMQYLIPALESLANKLNNAKEPALAAQVNGIVFALNDFNLSPLRLYDFRRYLNSSLTELIWMVSHGPVGYWEDRLFFELALALLQPRQTILAETGVDSADVLRDLCARRPVLIAATLWLLLAKTLEHGGKQPEFDTIYQGLDHSVLRRLGALALESHNMQLFNRRLSDEPDLVYELVQAGLYFTPGQEILTAGQIQMLRAKHSKALAPYTSSNALPLYAAQTAKHIINQRIVDHELL